MAVCVAPLIGCYPSLRLRLRSRLRDGLGCAIVWLGPALRLRFKGRTPAEAVIGSVDGIKSVAGDVTASIEKGGSSEKLKKYGISHLIVNGMLALLSAGMLIVNLRTPS